MGFTVAQRQIKSLQLRQSSMSSNNEDARGCGSKRLWSKQEDELLRSIVTETSAPRWAEISSKFNEQVKEHQNGCTVKRTNKQCRERWQNHLNPKLKNLPWQEDEHRALFKLFKDNSNQWCKLAELLESAGFEKRSDNNIKNYFYSALKRQIKRMNEVIRESNKEIKKKKSILHKYSEKYKYERRLSLQRQHKVARTSVFDSSQVNSSQNHRFESSCAAAESDFQKGSISEQNSDSLHIVKQLDQELINKILLIAEEKANKKYVISNSHTEEYHHEAVLLRDQLIELIVDRQKALDKDQVISLAKNMLSISRKCKKKNSRPALAVTSSDWPSKPHATTLTPPTNHSNFQFELPPKDHQDMELQPSAARKDSIDLSRLMENQEKQTGNNSNNIQVEKSAGMQRGGVDLWRSAFNWSIHSSASFDPFSVNMYNSGFMDRSLLPERSYYFDRSAQLNTNRCCLPPDYSLGNALTSNQPEGHQMNPLLLNSGQSQHSNHSQHSRQQQGRGFVDSIKNVGPSQVLQTPSSPYMNNPYVLPLFRPDMLDINRDNNNQALTTSWPRLGSNHPSYDGKPDSREDKSPSREGSLQRSQLLNRSWVYSDNRFEQPLSNSGNLEIQSQKGENNLQFKMPSNFQIFQGN